MTKLFPLASTMFVPLTCRPATLRADGGDCGDCADRADFAATSTNAMSEAQTTPTITADFLIISLGFGR
jgi:hypothetical protein